MGVVDELLSLYPSWKGLTSITYDKLATIRHYNQIILGTGFEPVNSK